MKTYAFILLMSIPLFSLSQDKYTQKTSTDQLDILYKWKYPVKKGVEQSAELLLKVTNKDDDPIAVKFEIQYTLSGRTIELFEVDTCLKAKKTIYGKLNGMYFVSESLSNEEIQSDGFKWEINDLATEEIEKCPVDK